MKILRNKKLFVVIAVLLAAGICALFLLLNEQEKPVPEFVFSYAENQTDDYPTTMGGYKFAELVEERTGGRIKILVQAEGILGDEKSVIEQVKFGGIDFTRVSLAHLAEFVPELMVLQMPYLYKDSEHMWEVLDGEIGSRFLNEINANDMIGLSWYDAGARNFYNSVRPINSLSDIAGLRIRVQESSLMTDIVEALGAFAVPLNYAEVYSGIQRGDADGAENNWPSYEAMEHYNVAAFYTVDEHIRIPEMQICGAYTWEKLSAEDQKIIRACAAESALYERKLWEEREIKSRETAIKNGAKVTELDDSEKLRFQNAVKIIYEKYCSEQMDIIDAIIEKGLEK